MDALKIFHNVIVHIYLKTATTEIKIFTNMALKRVRLKRLSKFQRLKR
jgi:hypothetical protein